MRVFLRAPAADRIIAAPEGNSPGATPWLASARRQPGPAPCLVLCADYRPDNSTDNVADNRKKAAVLAATSSLTSQPMVSRWLRDRTEKLILQLHCQLIPQVFQIVKLKNFVGCGPHFEIELLFFPEPLDHFLNRGFKGLLLLWRTAYP